MMFIRCRYICTKWTLFFPRLEWDMLLCSRKPDWCGVQLNTFLITEQTSPFWDSEALIKEKNLLQPAPLSPVTFTRMKTKLSLFLKQYAHRTIALWQRLSTLCRQAKQDLRETVHLLDLLCKPFFFSTLSFWEVSVNPWVNNVFGKKYWLLVKHHGRDFQSRCHTCASGTGTRLRLNAVQYIVCMAQVLEADAFELCCVIPICLASL